MNEPRCSELDYIQFLVAAQRVYTSTEAARTNPAGEAYPAHDAYTRLLRRHPPDSDGLWQEVAGCVDLGGGQLWIDDSTLDKPYARSMELVTRHWSGKHRRVVSGINLVTLLWTDGQAHLPCDWRLYDRPHDELTKNDHFRDMIHTAHQRGFQPRIIGFDSWYGSLANLKAVHDLDWIWLTQLKANRHVDPNRTGNRPLEQVLIGPTGGIVHLKGYGLIKVFKIAATDGSIEYWATNDLTMDLFAFAEQAHHFWKIENYHRGIKQFCGIERCQHRLATAQRNHIGFAIRAFLRLECHRLATGTSWFEAKHSIVRSAIAAYRAAPSYTSLNSATA
jgi:DDE superfamily endonuclease